MDCDALHICLAIALTIVGKVYEEARKEHAPMRGEHEGYAVILEELDELWIEIKLKYQDEDAIYREATHLAAMAVAFMIEVCGRRDG